MMVHPAVDLLVVQQTAESHLESGLYGVRRPGSNRQPIGFHNLAVADGVLQPGEGMGDRRQKYPAELLGDVAQIRADGHKPK